MVLITRRNFKVLFFASILVYSVLVFLQRFIYTSSVKYGVRIGHGIGEELLQTNNNRFENLTTEEEDDTVDEYNSTTIRPCKKKPSTLKGNLHFEIKKLPPSSRHSQLNGGPVNMGGSWYPKDCLPVSKVAILVPYRKRPQQLEVFLSHMHPIFQRQKLDYRIFVIEQAGSTPFNKGAIFNIGFNATKAYGDFGCYIFHDVDLLCEHDHNYYGCPSSPLHMSAAIDKFKYILPYNGLFGGIQAFTKEHYYKINGYSNRFWGWGAEDDNLYRRVVAKGLKLTRPRMTVARYKMNKAKHFRSDGWSQANMNLLYKEKMQQDSDGLNSFHKLNYKVKERLEPLFTLISIKLQR